MEGFDTLVININEGQVVQLLQHKVTGVIQDIGSRVAIDSVQEPLEGRAVEQILARMQLVANIHATILKSIQNRLPALG